MTVTTTAERKYTVTSRDAALQLGIHEETLRRWARERRVAGRKNMAGKWVFSQDDLDGLDVHAVIEREQRAS